MIAHDPQISNGVSLNYNEVSFEDLHTIFRLQIIHESWLYKVHCEIIQAKQYILPTNMS